jgi:hypothetical protein
MWQLAPLSKVTDLLHGADSQLGFLDGFARQLPPPSAQKRKFSARVSKVFHSRGVTFFQPSYTVCPNRVPWAHVSAKKMRQKVLALM